MKTRFIIQCAMAFALCMTLATGASATELKVRGNIDMYGMWSANLIDHNSDVSDGDKFSTTQRMRTYFDYVANENLKAVLGLEIDNVWGEGTAADWGTDGKGNIEVKHAYLDFTLPDTTVNIQAGLQYIALPSVFGNPVFDDDAAAITVSAPINDMFALAVGYSRGTDASTSFTGNGADNDDKDMAFIAAPITMDGFSVAPYFAYAWIGENTDSATTTGNFADFELGDVDESVTGDFNEDGDTTDIFNDVVFDGGTFTYANPADMTDDMTAWVLGFNAELTMFDPLTFAADVIYGEGETGDYETKGWYAALAASYKFEMLTATLFSTYATGADEDADEDNFLPTLAEGWGLSPYIGGVRAFSTTYDSFATDALGVGSDGTGLWTVGLVLDNISFVDKLSHKLVLAYAKGTSDEDSVALFTEEDSGFEAYLVNKYMIYENLAAINELGYFSGSSEKLEDDDYDLDASYFATIGFAYKF